MEESLMFSVFMGAFVWESEVDTQATADEARVKLTGRIDFACEFLHKSERWPEVYGYDMR
jgi:hypothetical protein